MTDDIWIISPQGQNENYNLSMLDLGLAEVRVKEYEISSIAKYLLNPNSIKAERKVVGFRIHYNPKSLISRSAREKFPKTLQNIINNLFPGKPVKPKLVIVPQEFVMPEGLSEVYKQNIEQRMAKLKPYKPFNRNLNKIDPSVTSHLTGIYEYEGTLKQFNLIGTLQDQINYMGNNISNDVKLFLPPAQKEKGGFDLSELDLHLYDSKETYRLLCFDYNNAHMACVLDSERRIEYMVEDTDSIKLMHMFDLAIRINPSFKNQMESCVRGMAQPKVLAFKDELEMNWYEGYLPAFYERACSTFDITVDDKKEISKMLNDSMFTSVGMVSVLENDSFFSYVAFHDFEDLKPMEKGLPSLYNAIKHNTHDIAGKKVYLVDVVGGRIK